MSSEWLAKTLHELQRKELRQPWQRADRASGARMVQELRKFQFLRPLYMLIVWQKVIFSLFNIYQYLILYLTVIAWA